MFLVVLGETIMCDQQLCVTMVILYPTDYVCYGHRYYWLYDHICLMDVNYDLARAILFHQGYLCKGMIEMYLLLPFSKLFSV